MRSFLKPQPVLFADNRSGDIMQRLIGLISIIVLGQLQTFAQQPAAQVPSPMVEHTRPHTRVPETPVAGRRVDLRSLKGATLFIGPRVNPNRPVPLLIHFHGSPSLVEQHVAVHLPQAALITVQLGAGSSVYRRPFAQTETMRNILQEASDQLHLKHGWSSITLSGFSAGYGAVREILRSSEYFAQVNNVLLLDGMHAGYVPEGKPLAEGGVIDANDLDSFLSFAKAAVSGKKTFVITHSEIFPGVYASTTECADYLLSQLGLRSRPQLRARPYRFSSCDARVVRFVKDTVDYFRNLQIRAACQNPEQ